MTIYNTCECNPDCPNTWLFLGCSVVSFSAVQGSSDGSSNITVDLVEDPETACDGRVKKYLDENLNVQNTTGPDPGFFGLQTDIIGVPVLFVFEQFEFTGIVSSWKERRDPTTQNRFSVVVESPNPLLANVEIILDNYTGSVISIPNVINAYGFYERDTCDTFGDSGNYGRGMAWNDIKAAIAVLASMTTPILPKYLQSGRIKHVPGKNGGFGLIPETDTGYMLDLSEVPTAPDYYRFSGDSISLQDAISKVCSDAVIEWFPELYACTYNGTIYKIIKIRTIDRSISPVPGAIDRFINLYSANYCGVESWEKGQEQRDDVMHSLVIGGARQVTQESTWARLDNPTSTERCVYTGEQETHSVTFPRVVKRNANGEKEWTDETVVLRKRDKCTTIDVDVFDLSNDTIAPYWGLDVNGDVITSYTIDFFPEDTGLSTGPSDSPVYFLGNSWPLNDKLFRVVVAASLELGEGELMASLAGFDAWKSYIHQNGTATAAVVEELENIESARHHGVHDLQHMPRLAGDLVWIKPVHMLSLRQISNNNPIDEQIHHDIQVMYDWVHTYATQYYGKKFIVKIPSVCVAQDATTRRYKWSYEISDGGWPELGSTLLDINLASTDMDFFRENDGRIRAFCKFNNANLLNFDGLTDNDYGYYDNGNGYLYLKCEVSKQIVFGDLSTLSTPHAVITLPQAIKVKDGNIWVERDGTVSMLQWGGLKGWYANHIEGLWLTAVKDAGGAASKGGYYPERAAQPDGIVLGLKSNIDNYGPWIATNGTAIGGGVKYTQDNSITPWNFGSISNMEAVGTAQAQEGVSSMIFSESGQLVVPGIPRGRIGDELLSINGSGYMTGQFLTSTRTATVNTGYGGSQYLSLNMILGGRWIGTWGPTISSINVVVVDRKVTTTYTMSSYTRKLRKFSQSRLNNLKEYGELKQELLQQLSK